MPLPSHTSSVPQAVGRVAGVITEIQVVRPVVSRVIIAVADELVAAELPAQHHHHHHHRTVEHDAWTRQDFV
jgi:hypothetical protein